VRDGNASARVDDDLISNSTRLGVTVPIVRV
jgi:hypothetical protein